MFSSILILKMTHFIWTRWGHVRASDESKHLSILQTWACMNIIHSFFYFFYHGLLWLWHLECTLKWVTTVFLKWLMLVCNPHYRQGQYKAPSLSFTETDNLIQAVVKQLWVINKRWLKMKSLYLNELLLSRVPKFLQHVKMALLPQKQDTSSSTADSY